MIQVVSDFSHINISQGSVATHLMHDGIFYYCLAKNFLASLPAKELWKSVSIWQRQRQKYSGTFFPDTVYVKWLMLKHKLFKTINTLLNSNTVKPLIPACHLFNKFHELNKIPKLNGHKLQQYQYHMPNYVPYKKMQKIRGQNNFVLKWRNLRAAKLRSFTVNNCCITTSNIGKTTPYKQRTERYNGRRASQVSFSSKMTQIHQTHSYCWILHSAEYNASSMQQQLQINFYCGSVITATSNPATLLTRQQIYNYTVHCLGQYVQPTELKFDVEYVQQDTTRTRSLMLTAFYF